jgi:hypothetical protein
VSASDGIRIIGILAEDAHLLLRNDGTAEVHVRVQQDDPHRSIAIGAQVHGNSHAAQYAAQNGARRMRKGEPVTVHARCYDIVRGRLLLLDVTLIECAAMRDRTAPREVAHG